MDNELALRLFVSMVEEGGISRGGERHGLPQSTSSRMIAQFEKRLGAKLLQRSTRKLSLTEAGEIYFERARNIVTELDEAADAISELSKTPSGLLRVTAPAAFGRLYISPVLEEFRAAYPDISVGLSLSDQFEDLIGRGFDVAIRLGQLEDSSLIARKIGQSDSVLCASPPYLERMGTPKTPDDLKTHNCLQFRSFPGQNRWKLTHGDQQVEIAVSGSLFSNSGEALLSAAVNHLGIVYLPRWLVTKALETNELALVLPEWALADSATSIQAVVGHRQHVPPKVEAFVSFLGAKLKNPVWHQG